MDLSNGLTVERVREWAAKKPMHEVDMFAIAFNDRSALAREVLRLHAKMAEAVAISEEAVGELDDTAGCCGCGCCCEADHKAEAKTLATLIARLAALTGKAE